MAKHKGTTHYQAESYDWIGAGRLIGTRHSTGQGVDVVMGKQGPEKTGPWHGSPATVKGSGMKHGSHGSNPGKMKGRGGY